MRMRDLGLPDSVETHEFSDAETAGVALAAAVADHLSQRLLVAPRASLVVSGGSTPLPFFRALREKPLDWRRIDVLLADERWVPETDADSNTKLVKAELLQGPASEAHYLSLKQPGKTPQEGLALVMDVLKDLQFPLDVLVLGMGNDGHTASLFPDAPELKTAMDPNEEAKVAAVNPSSQPQQRVTLTYPALREAGFTALHISGDDKLETLEKAIAKMDQVEEMPIRAFLKPGLKIFWSAQAPRKDE